MTCTIQSPRVRCSITRPKSVRVGHGHGPRSRRSAITSSTVEVLSGAVETIAGVTQSRKNVPVVIQLRVDRGGPDPNLRVMTVEIRDTHVGREQTHKPQIARAMLLEPIDGRDGGVAGGEHRIHRNYQPLAQIRG